MNIISHKLSRINKPENESACHKDVPGAWLLRSLSVDERMAVTGLNPVGNHDIIT